ncbi:hypothetical protein GCM10022289_20310 [Pedobacter jeongneungensis]|uniref:FAD dependent oxidoreductase n=1 Tax=Pedobacter jeongneungensis TaxID=947309 RepID=A0ABP8BCV2_9SPHI
MPTGLSYWEKESFFYNHDAIIIGSGIVVLNAAIHLQKLVPSLKMAIPEKGFIPTDANTKNAGFTCFGSISEPIEREEITGIHRACSTYWKTLKGPSQTYNLLGDNTIDY